LLSIAAGFGLAATTAITSHIAIMRKISLTLLPLAAAAVSLHPAPAPAYGPGAVLATLRRATAALDQGHADDLRACFDLGRTPHVWFETDAGEGRMAGPTEACALTGVGADGQPFEADSLAKFTASALKDIGGRERAVTSKLLSVRADCASAECSFAVADVERTYAGKEPTSLRVRITALMRYDHEARGFSIFHWHESLRP